MFDNLTNRMGAGILAGATIAGLAGCSDSGRLSSVAPPVVTDLGEGIYQFPVAEWPQSLVKFRKEHRELEIIDTEIASTIGSGADPNSFIVITKPATDYKADRM